MSLKVSHEPFSSILQIKLFPRLNLDEREIGFIFYNHSRHFCLVLKLFTFKMEFWNVSKNGCIYLRSWHFTSLFNVFNCNNVQGSIHFVDCKPSFVSRLCVHSKTIWSNSEKEKGCSAVNQHTSLH